MLIRNYKIFNPSVTDNKDEQYHDAVDYRAFVKEMGERFPSGMITFKRIGWPRQSKDPRDSGLDIFPEIPAPINLRPARNDNGIYWAYCRGRAVIQANGLADIPPDEYVILDGEVKSFDLKRDTDLLYFLVKKYPVFAHEYAVFDPEGDRKRELKDKNARIRLQSSIRDISEEKLRTMAGAWAIPESDSKDMLLLQDDLEKKVLSQEEFKKKNPTDFSIRGIDEFFADMKNDEVVRPKSFLQKAIARDVVTFNARNSHYYVGEMELCYVPVGSLDRRVEFLLQVLLKPENRERWVDILRQVVDQKQIEEMDKYGKRWLAGQVGVALNQKEEELTTALLGVFCAE